MWSEFRRVLELTELALAGENITLGRSQQSGECSASRLPVPYSPVSWEGHVI